MKFKKESQEIETPKRGHSTDAGYDIYSPHTYIVPPRSVSQRINLGVGFEIPEGYMGVIEARSSQGKIGISSAGKIVDHKYTGYVHVTLVNNGSEPYVIKRGDRICQLLLVKIGMEELEEVDSFEITERGDGREGSTGK